MIFNLHYTSKKFTIPSNVTEFKFAHLSKLAIKGTGIFDTYLKRKNCERGLQVIKIPIKVLREGILYTPWDRVPYVDILIGFNRERIYDKDFLNILTENPESIPCVIDRHYKVIAYLVADFNY